MRHRLIMELTAKRALQRPPQPSQGSRSLALRAGDSLVADYLSRRNLEYTLSVFVPEAGLSKQKVSWWIFFAFAFFKSWYSFIVSFLLQLLSCNELLDLLHINPHSKFHKSLVSWINFDVKNCWFQKLRFQVFHISSQYFDDFILLNFSWVGTIDLTFHDTVIKINALLQKGTNNKKLSIVSWLLLTSVVIFCHNHAWGEEEESVTVPCGWKSPRTTNMYFAESCERQPMSLSADKWLGP